MAKIKKNPYQLGSPKGDLPMKEMSWCMARKVYVSCKPKAVLEGKYWKQLNEYCLTIRNGDNYKESEYIYNKDNVMNAIWDTYKYIYKKNYDENKST